ncbi:glycoside hydrolase family 35 protein [Moniliophthora roreri MCA 2997]|uniref:beta-galactosidase n=1 Tax=Moniliophthora roreri (strain MCA 2997) TaxID=1381753 RepID=V2Y5W6_MONRO|nr:glycoside hydrolase family 35 protein [Moniliophthora roreri MCA 2997]
MMGNKWLNLQLCIASMALLVALAMAGVQLEAQADLLARRQYTGTGDVQFDNYSLILNGQRIFLHSSEFHTFRIPIPSLWPDILQKYKAAGLNSISVYEPMVLLNPSRGVVDFDGWRGLKQLYEVAMEIGLWVVMRPGPYINAEVSAGGVSHWITSEIAGDLRSNDSDWREAWQDYILGVIRETRDYQITNGGPVIAIQLDNEYTAEEGMDYFEDLKRVYQDPANGIVVPLTYNDPYQGKAFINGTGSVDLYGLDSYPQAFDCSHPDLWKPVTPNYHQYHQEVNPSQPWYIPEFQAGSYDPWGPAAPGYEQCRKLTDADFESVFNLQLWASNAKLINYYMVYGGTSWGGIPFHGVYTSYDYGAPIAEARTLTPKYTQLKMQGIFLRSSPEFYKTNWIGDTSTNLTEGGVSAVNNTPPAFVTLLRNPDSDAGFWILRQNDSTSTSTSIFNLDITTKADSTKPFRLPYPIILQGRESKVIVTGYLFGASSRLTYTTAQVLFAGVIDGRDVLFLYGDSDQAYITSVNLTGTSSPARSPFIQVDDRRVITILAGAEGLLTVWDSETQLVLYADTPTAETFYAPAITVPNSDDNPYSKFWSFGTNETVLVAGPYLVREATYSKDRKQLDLRGDLDITTNVTNVTLVAPKTVTSVTWNGMSVSLDDVLGSVMTGTISSSKSGLLAKDTVVELGPWKYADSLPEIRGCFDDSGWVEANHTQTNIPHPMLYGDGRVLYGCDYGFCENIALWRGHFMGTGMEKSVNLSVNGGEAFAASVWLNDVFLKTTYGNSTNNNNIIAETDEVFAFPEGIVEEGEINVITIVQDNMGLDEAEDNRNSMKSPRGIRGFQLNTGNFLSWKVQGKIGGYTNFPDKVRGLLNEGGLFGERKGWHLPGFDSSTWESRDELSLDAEAGVGFFVTTFELDTPCGIDIMMSFVFEEEFGLPYRALLFVNGWMMGKRVGNLGPQAKFPVHEGILNYHGMNTMAIALWAMEPGIDIVPQLRLVVDSVFEGGVGRIEVNNPGWTAQGRE